MIRFAWSTYFFRVIIVPPVGSKPLTYKVSTKHAFRRLLGAMQVGDMKKII